MEIKDSTIHKLEEIQNSFYRSLLNVPHTTSEVKIFIAKLGLPDCFLEKISRRKWKTLLKKAIGKANELEIRKSLKAYKKVDNNITEKEKFECKEYLSSLTLNQARILFHHKYSMTENVKNNFKGNKAYARVLWKCEECSNLDTESHSLNCEGYTNLRMGLDLNNNKDLCSYLQKIIQIRCKKNSKK